MQGTPYIFQGEELGMTNIKLDISQYVDVEILNLYKERTAAGYSHESVMDSIYARGRDNARTPMQWTAGENAGFTTGTPWLTVNANKETINAEAALADPNSTFYYYQKLIAIRKQYDVIRSGSFSLLCPEDEKVFAYTRDTEHGHLLVVCNFSGEEVGFDFPTRFNGAQMILSNYEGDAPGLRPYEAAMFYYED
jgi:glucan 1,6-alpha-glucosidase